MKDVYRNYLDGTEDAIPYDHCIGPLAEKIKAYEVRLASHHLFKSVHEAEEPNEEYHAEEKMLELEDELREMYIKLERYYA
jgi:hypothetical protein|tara:strand:- start:368 stop:610 length:243 start_codon:yes stop_codon:yes gene_type:complete